jgi:hypothetical protein
MGIMQRSGMCRDAGDCLVTSAAFVAVFIAWVVLVFWSFSGILS